MKLIRFKEGYSREQMERYYIKLRKGEGRQNERASYHIHVDSQEQLSDEITKRLLDAGLTYDLFDLDFHVYGREGDPNQPFPHYAPVQHMTFVTGNTKQYREKWSEVETIISESGAKCYIEGELIILDEELSTKPFDESEYEACVPETEDPELSFVSAIDNSRRTLPANVTLRRLDPEKNGNRDRFRNGEMHLTVRDDIHPKLLELLCNLGFSVPAIPKLLEGEDGKIETCSDGSLKIIRDIPLTLQAMDMKEVVKVANLAVTLINRIGGLSDGSVKIEFAIDFAILNGVDYSQSVPPVISGVTYHDSYQHLSDQKIGDTSINLAELTRLTKDAGESAPHWFKKRDFEDVIENTLN